MKIVDKKILGVYKDIRIIEIKVEAPHIVKNASAGQFVVVIVNEQGERIPLTIVDSNRENGLITLIFQEVGLTTRLLGKKEVGESVYALVGPLGNSTVIKNYGQVIIIGGGVGIGEILPVGKVLRKAGNKIVSIIGARNKELLILKEEIGSISERLYIVTDDGSYGEKGFVTDILERILTPEYSLVYAVGPVLMMREVSRITGKLGVKTLVSLNALMVDATGMCGCCRVTVGEKTVFSCVDGPEFDGALVNWDELAMRLGVYRDKEEHICKLYREKGMI